MPKQTECPRCGITWEGEEIPVVLHATGDYNMVEAVRVARNRYGWDESNRKRFSVNVLGIEILGAYDGASFWECLNCHAHINRFTDKVTVQSSGQFSLEQTEGEA